MSIEPCHGCGWDVEGGFKRCKARFEEFLARDFADARYFKTHRLFVDTYCLQHPEEYCASAKSLAAHLVGICWILEEGASAAVGPRELHRWLSGKRAIEKPAIPATRGKMTIGDLPLNGAAAAWHESVHSWARSTWQAYASLNRIAHEWLQQARSGH